VIDLTIDRLNLDIENGAGHEHRVQPIAARASRMLGERLVELGDNDDGALRSTTIDSLSTPRVELDLTRLDDEQAADRVAAAIFAALKPRLGV
jgi:ABC-type phosphonate transport system ATPase subunit